MAKKKTKKKIKRSVEDGVINIHATFSNTIITISDPQGDVIAWSSGGARGFKGTRKGTPFAAQIAAEDVAKRAIGSGMKTARVYVRGPGPGRESAIRSIQTAGIRVASIRDVTPIPHNGCRPPGKRRV
ncbi:MAG: 30S ribosomal protein S11 [Thermodesulfobacteriota bacterium]